MQLFADMAVVRHCCHDLVCKIVYPEASVDVQYFQASLTVNSTRQLTCVFCVCTGKGKCTCRFQSNSGIAAEQGSVFAQSD